MFTENLLIKKSEPRTEELVCEKWISVHEGRIFNSFSTHSLLPFLLKNKERSLKRRKKWSSDAYA